MTTREDIIMGGLGSAGRAAYSWLSDAFPRFGTTLIDAVADLEKHRGTKSPSIIRENFEKRNGNMRIVPVSSLGFTRASGEVAPEPARQHLFHYPAGEGFDDFTIDPHSVLGSQPQRIALKNGNEEWLFNDLEPVRVNPAWASCAGGGNCVPRALHGFFDGRKSYVSIVKDLQNITYKNKGEVTSPVEGTSVGAIDDFLLDNGYALTPIHDEKVHINTRYADLRNLIQNQPGNILASVGMGKPTDPGHLMLFRDGVQVAPSRNDVYSPRDYDYIDYISEPAYADELGGRSNSFMSDMNRIGLIEKLEDQGKYSNEDYYKPIKDDREGFIQSRFLRNYKIDGSLGPPYMQLDRFYRAHSRP